ncbi:MAG TPA: creatininase family protein [Negativicutes bacterium]|nr:creatininase family protein [Negativicutes bacterium]
MEKRALHLMTWKEIDEAFKTDPVIIIPMGSMEQHGPQSITGDYLAAEAIAKQVAEKTGAYYLPVIPFGCSEYFRGFPGTISLQPQTVAALISDVCESLIEHGITKIFFLNGHAGNVSTIDQVARQIRREKKIVCVSIDLWQSLMPDFKKEVYKQEKDPSGHGAEPLTSVMSYLYPDMMRMDLLEPINNNNMWGEFPIKTIKQGAINGIPVNLYLDMEDLSKQGVLGDPSQASAQRGEMIVNCMINFCAAVVEKLRATPTTR